MSLHHQLHDHHPLRAVRATLLAAGLALLALAPAAQAVTSCGNPVSPPRGDGPSTPEGLAYRPQARPGAANTPQGEPAPGFSANQTGRVAQNYFAVGNEPGWSAEITLTRPLSILVKTDNGAKTFQVNSVRARAASWSGTATDGTAIRLNCTATACQDTMSGKVFPGTATLIVGKKTFRGCGGFRD